MRHTTVPFSMWPKVYLDYLEGRVREVFHRAGDYSASALWAEDGEKYLRPLVKAGRMYWTAEPNAARFVADELLERRTTPCVPTQP